MQLENTFILHVIVKLLKRSLNHFTGKEQRILSEDQKHSSAVAKVHYQKQRSQEVAVKGHECLQKLQGAKSSEVDEDVQARFGGSTSTSSVETVQTNGSPPAKKDVPPQENWCLWRKSRRIFKFSADEDDFLKEGITKHGFG